MEPQALTQRDDLFVISIVDSDIGLLLWVYPCFPDAPKYPEFRCEADIDRRRADLISLQERGDYQAVGEIITVHRGRQRLVLKYSHLEFQASRTKLISSAAAKNPWNSASSIAVAISSTWSSLRLNNQPPSRMLRRSAALRSRI